MTFKETAIKYAERGWYIFPLMFKSKKPFHGSKGLHEASNNPKLAEKIWGKLAKANIGLRTGAESGIVVLDIDRQSAYQFLESRGFEIPETLTARTYKGKQYYFKHPGFPMANGANMGAEDKRDKDKATGIDFRGDGGYVVAPPSLHPDGENTSTGFSGAYEFEDPDAEIADCPKWLIDFHEEDKNHRAEVRESVVEGGGDIPEGARDQTLTSIAGNLRRSGHEYAHIRRYLMMVNAENCKPPLPQEDIDKIANSVCKYDPATLLVSEAEQAIEMMKEVQAEQGEAKQTTEGTKRGLELQLTRRTHGAGRRAQFVATIFFKGRTAVLDGITGNQLITFSTIRGLAVEEGLFLPNSKQVVNQWSVIVQKALEDATVETREADEDAVGACMLVVAEWVGDLGEAGTPEDIVNDPEGSKFKHEEGWLVNNAALRRAVKVEAPDAGRDEVSKALRLMNTKTITMKVEIDGRSRTTKFRFIPEEFNGCKTIPQPKDRKKAQEVSS